MPSWMSAEFIVAVFLDTTDSIISTVMFPPLVGNTATHIQQPVIAFTRLGAVTPDEVIPALVRAAVEAVIVALPKWVSYTPELT